MDAKQKRIVKVARFRILKPAGDLTWNDLKQLLRDARYRVYRLGNLAVSEAYLNFHLWRTGRADEFKTAKMSELNKRLREMLAAEGTPPEQLDRFSKTGALPDYVVGALTQYKIGAVTNVNKWRDVVRGHVSLPTFRGDMAIPVRCDKPDYRRLEQADNGEVHLDLQICMRPYPRVILGTRNIGDGQTAILQRLLANTAQSLDGCRQRCFEITQDRNDGKWWLRVTYDFPALQPAPRAGVVVGVDLGVSLPLYAAINNGHARLGGRQFGALGRRIRALQDQVDADSEAKIHRALEELMGGRTCFVIAHRFSTVISADLIVVMEDGQIEAKGTHEELIESSELYRSLYETQLVVPEN